MFGNFGQESVSTYDKMVTCSFCYKGKGRATSLWYVKGVSSTPPAVTVRRRGGGIIRLVRVFKRLR